MKIHFKINQRSFHREFKRRHQKTNALRKTFSLRAFCIQIWGKLKRKVTFNRATSEPADEEDLPTFSLGLEFPTTKNEPKKMGKKKNN